MRLAAMVGGVGSVAEFLVISGGVKSDSFTQAKQGTPPRMEMTGCIACRILSWLATCAWRLW